MEKIFQTIWEMSLFAVPVILILAICSNLLGKRYGARWRYLVWLVVAIRLCVPIQLSLPGRMEIMQVQVPSVQSSTREVLAQRTPDYFVQRDTAEPTEPATPIAPAEQTQEESAEKRDAFDFLLAYPYVLWLGGVLGFLAWQGWKYYDFRRMLKRNRRKIMDASVLDTYYTLCRETGMEKRPAIYFCEALPSPLCVGLFRTAVYLNSEEREPAEMRLILKHELTHCKRKDLWFKGLLLWARALHFFQPLCALDGTPCGKGHGAFLRPCGDGGLRYGGARGIQHGNPADSARGEKQKYADEYGFFGRKGGIEDAV